MVRARESESRREHGPSRIRLLTFFFRSPSLSLPPHAPQPTLAPMELQPADLEPTRKLTKKEKKALAFRANKGKGKGKKDDDADQTAVPDQEDLDVAEEDRVVAPNKQEVSKKRKRVEGEEEVAKGLGGEEDKVGEGEPEKKKKRQRGKKKSLQGGVGEDGQPKLLLFVGEFRLSRAGTSGIESS